MADLPEMATGVPLGIVLPFAGDARIVPVGWILCDGRPLEIRHHPRLFAVLGTAWGGNRVQGFFNLPDLRGVFVRGVSGSTLRDPDAESRSSINPGGNVGNSVGSLQEQETKVHNHPLTENPHHHELTKGFQGHEGLGFNKDNRYSGGGADKFGLGGVLTIRAEPTTTGISIANSGGSETRPINAYVNWIIWAPEGPPAFVPE